MPQEQRIVPLLIYRREPGQAVATGNTAAWICVCRKAMPLIGRVGSVKGFTGETTVICPDCNRRYFVVPEAADPSSVQAVQEI